MDHPLLNSDDLALTKDGVTSDQAFDAVADGKDGVTSDPTSDVVAGGDAENSTRNKVCGGCSRDSKKTRVFGLDLLRVLACYMVMQVHAGEFYYIGENGSLLSGPDVFWVNLYGSLMRTSVPLFVLITGYFILPVEGKLTMFFKKRFMRVLIPFLVWCILYSFYFFILGRYTLGTAFLNILKIAVNFGVEIGHLWYVYMLIGLYLFFPLISAWLKVASVRNLQFYLSLWAVSLFLPYAHAVFPEVLGEAPWNHTPLLCYFSGFLGYAVIAFHVKKFRAEIKILYQVIAGIVLVLAGYVITYFVFVARTKTVHTAVDVELSWGFETVNVAMMTMGIFLLVKNIPESKKLSHLNALVTSISNLSYGMYLLHIMILNAFYWLFNKLINTAAIKIPLLAVCCFISSYLITLALSFIPGSKFVIG